MDKVPAHDSISPEISTAAAAWVLKCDRGLTATEQDEYFAWLAADPRHAAALKRHGGNWRRLNRLAEWRPEHSALPNPDLLAPPLRVRARPYLRPALATLALAAAVALAFLALRPEPATAPARGTPAPLVAAAGPAVTLQALPDGSMAELNRGAVIAIDYSAGERRVRLEAGEVHFTVTRDVARPFLVQAGGVTVRAVGTAFNVRLDREVVEVLVTEGRVQVTEDRFAGWSAAPGESLPPELPVLEARQRVVVPVAEPVAQVPQVAVLTSGEIERVLSWQHRLLDFTATPLADVLAEFNRRNAVRLVLADPELASMPVSVTFRSDNVEGFVGLLEAGFNLRVERRGDREILLRR